MVIADKLYVRDVEYVYDQPVVLPNGHTRYPDFNIVDHARGVTFYWEQLGISMIRDTGRAGKRSAKEYLESGSKPSDEVADAESVLIETRDQPGGGLDAPEIARMIDQVVRD